MRIYLLIICAALSVSAERIQLDKGGDSNLEALFNQLGRFQHTPESSQTVKESGSALSALLRAMAPRIKEMLGYTGIFKGTCSVFFRDSIDSAACDMKPTDARQISVGSEVTEAKYLPAKYQHQITLTHILLASVFADWRHGKLQEFDTDLYFKQDTCSLSASLSESETLSSTPRLPPMLTVAPTSNPTAVPTAIPTLRPTFSPTAVPTTTVPNSTGLLAAWSQSSGVYADVTNQAGRYNISAGVVTDTLTNIQWEQAASANAMSWTDAIAYCGNQTTGGLTGWRLPNIAELGTLVDYNASSPYVNTTAFPGTPEVSFWASTSVAGSAGNSWDLQLETSGRLYWNTVATLDRIRCLRSNYLVPPSSSRYTVSAGEVTDSVTGLIWQQASLTTGGPNFNGRYSQSGASGYCAALGLNARTWRLPTVKELATLINYSVNQGSLMMNSVFTGPADAYWSSTALADIPSFVWNVYFNDGSVASGYVSTTLCVRCVR